MHTRPSCSGVALIIVLSFLVLISAITLGFFSSVSTELAASKSVSNSALTKQLADSAVNVVMAQIVDATKGLNGNARLAWASQPGMIRTFDASGGARDFYKLYSSDQLTVSGTGFSAEVPPNNWNALDNAEYFTDLNAPAFDSSGTLVYPIVDPGAETKGGLEVQGFSLASSPGFSPGTESPVNNRAPMPVKWLYVLKDGTIKAPSAPSAAGVTVAGATTANPIVGRIAFWTDDETAKVNINTASEGVYWDIPRIFSQEDVGLANGTISPGTNAALPGLALCQPANREYQRYPGHPATTSLSPIFGKILPSPVPAGITTATVPQLDQYYNIAPRIGLASFAGGGGSNGGTRIPATSVTTDGDRLYASIDELMFKPTIDGSGKRLANTSTNSSPKLITKSTLDKTRFFITANSSAPEVTLYNTPRVGIWPVDFIPGKRTAYDKLSAFCGTIGGQEYAFTRQTLTGGAYLGSRSPSIDLSPRNMELYSYLRKMTQTDIPGFGGKFSDKFQTDNDQILTSIYDYIRCVNLSDTTAASATTPKASPFTPQANFNLPPSGTAGAGEVVPIRIGNLQGFGRFNTVTEFDLLFYGTSATTMRAVVLMGFGTPMQGNVGYQSRLKYRITGLPDMLKIPNGGTNYIEVSDLHTHHGRGLGGLEGPSMAFLDRSWTDNRTDKNLAATPGGSVKGSYPFFSSADIPFTGTFFSLPEANIKVEILTADTGAAGDHVVQTLNFKLPATPRIKAPGFTAASANFRERISAVGRHDFNRLIEPLDTVIGLQIAGVSGNDNTAGDMRMTAAKITVPDTAFQPHKDWSNTESKAGKAHGLYMSLGNRYNGATSSPLVAGAVYMGGEGGDRQPGIPSRVAPTSGVRRADNQPGDWDTGTGVQKDGAYINKADEGDQQFIDYVGGGNRIPYISKDDHFQANGTVFSPNRQIASPLMFGSIPTGVQRNLPWQTLLFHPRPEDPTHPGKTNGQPRDHLLADLFWMPVVEPYAISQPFATNGKINLNYQIQPFTYIKRSTGLHAVMKATQFMALTVDDARDYKPHVYQWPIPTPKAVKRRYTIDMEKTLADFEAKFANNQIFKSATEICEMNLIPPQVANTAGMTQFWTTNKLTGDNLREKPYVDLYPRLTTKSNSFTVHVRVQALKKVPGTAAGQWVTGRDKVVGEYRGSSLLERYIDVNDPTLPNFATKFINNPSDADLNIDKYYKMRVVSTKRFAP